MPENVSPRSPAVEQYLRRKAELAIRPALRESCVHCRKPRLTCYCPQVSPIATDPRFLILMHPLEAKHPVGTGRMAHLCLKNSSLIIGPDFAHDDRVNALIEDPALFPMVLFPGPRSVNLSSLPVPARRDQIPAGREPVVIVLDGTWHCARKMLHRSPNLQRLPRICFVPSRLSEFQVRKQPHPQCFSTIEAVHELIDLFAGDTPEAPPLPHDVLLEVFRDMVRRQLSFRREGPTRHSLSYLARKARRAAERARREKSRSDAVRT